MVSNIQSSAKKCIACAFVKHTSNSVIAAPQYKQKISRRTSVDRVFFTEKSKTFNSCSSNLQRKAQVLEPFLVKLMPRS